MTELKFIAHEMLRFHSEGMSHLRWNESERHKVAKMLLKKHPRLGLDKLVAAIRECECKITSLSGWDALGECAEECLEKRGAPGVTASAGK